jgi:hypothetical protein
MIVYAAIIGSVITYIPMALLPPIVKCNSVNNFSLMNGTREPIST